MSKIIGVRNNNTIVPLSSGSTMPAGTIISYSGSIAAFTSTSAADSTTLIHKDGWAVCNGASIPFATYADLYARLSTTWNAATNPLTGSAQSAPADTGVNFRIPNLQGVFLRGVGDYAGADAYSTDNDVTLAVYKADQTQGHDHEMTAADSGPSNTIDVWVRQGFDTGTYKRSAFNAFDMVTDGTNGTPRTGKETNPKQVGVYYLVKLYDNLAAADVYIAPASITESGLVTPNAQTIAGVKTFNDGVKLDDAVGQSTLNSYIASAEGDLGTVSIGGTWSTIDSKKYKWIRIGNLVIFTARIESTTAASALTLVYFTLPSDCPTPAHLSTTGTNEWSFSGSGTNATSVGDALYNSAVSLYAVSGGTHVYAYQTAASTKIINMTVTYFTS